MSHALDEGPFLIGVEVIAPSPVTVSIFRGFPGLLYAWHGEVPRAVERSFGGVLSRHRGVRVSQVFGLTRLAGEYSIVVESEREAEVWMGSSYWEVADVE